MILGLGNVVSTIASSPQPIASLAASQNTLPYPPPTNIFSLNLIANANTGKIVFYIKDYKSGLFSIANLPGLGAGLPFVFQGTPNQPLLDFTVFYFLTATLGDGFGGWVLF